MPSTLKTAFLWLCTGAIICVAFALMEYTARKIAYGRFGVAPSGHNELILDRWTAFRNNPNYRSDGVQVNAQGFRRDQDVRLVKPPNSIRVFLLGGSVAYGGDTLYPELTGNWKIRNHETIDYYLEKRLNSSFPAKHWE